MYLKELGLDTSIPVGLSKFTFPSTGKDGPVNKAVTNKGSVKDQHLQFYPTNIETVTGAI